jgi:hypothetical protein
MLLKACVYTINALPPNLTPLFDKTLPDYLIIPPKDLKNNDFNLIFDYKNLFKNCN